jgi:chemotaxis protein MotB
MRKKKHPEHVNHERWLISYADFITLLFAFFVVMFSVSQVDSNKVGRFSESFSVAIGLPLGNASGIGVLPGAKISPGMEMLELPSSGLDDIAASLRAHLESSAHGKVSVIRQKSEIVLRFSEAVTFASGDDRLKDPAIQAIRAIADDLRGKDVNLRVEGHTDDIPIKNARFRSNWELSTARATTVVAELLGPGQIPPGRLAAAGYAEFHAIAPNTTAEQRALNRRVDVVVTLIPKEPEGKPEAKPKGEAKAEAEPESKGKRVAKTDGEHKPEPKAEHPH